VPAELSQAFTSVLLTLQSVEERSAFLHFLEELPDVSPVLLKAQGFDREALLQMIELHKDVGPER
jgi:hypothetical protein